MEAVSETIGIGEAARALGISIDTLRYYERAGLLDGILRTEGNQRRYDEAALTAVNFIKGCGALALDDSVRRAIWKTQSLQLRGAKHEAGSIEIDFTP